MKSYFLFFTVSLVFCAGCAHHISKTASTEYRAAAERALLMDARHIAAACQQFMFDQKKDKAVFSIDPKTGELSGDLAIYGQRLAPGTQATPNFLEHSGHFSLRNPDAFGGAEITFDDFGERIK
jgi:hypothetical protein